MKLSYVGDGPRDEAMLPQLVEKVVGPHEKAAFVAWHDLHLHAGRGYGRKLAFVVATAERDRHDGVVAVVDTDGDRSRLGQLTTERQRLRDQGRALAVAVGAAHPHGEAWLVDDLVPLRTVLGHPPTAPAPPGRNPKAELAALVEASTFADPTEAVPVVAAAVDPARCRRAKDTGLAAFVDDLRSEFSGR